MRTRTLDLIRVADSGSIVEGNLHELFELARLNKILLGFLRRVGYNGPQRTLEENRYRQYMNEVAKVSEAINSLDYLYSSLGSL